MFDFIKNMFKGSARRQQEIADKAMRPEPMDVVETNDIEILKTSEFSEGKPAEVLEEFVEETEIPPPPDLDLPEAQLDEPSNDVVLEVPEAQEPVEPDNYLTGDLNAARMVRNIQTREAAVGHWTSSSARYRPRQRRAGMVEGSTAKIFDYFDAINSGPHLRQMELDKPGMSMESVSLNKLLNEVSKEKLIEEYIERSMDSIKIQQESGAIALPTTARQRFGLSTGSGVTSQAEHKLRGLFAMYESKEAEHKLRDVFIDFESKQAAIDEPPAANYANLEAILDEILGPDEHEEPARDENFTRWLLKVAEEATESDDVLWLLAQDPNPDVRFCLAENYEINPEILSTLSEDDNPYVANRAQKTIMRMRSPGVLLDRDFGSAVYQQRKSG